MYSNIHLISFYLESNNKLGIWSFPKFFLHDTSKLRCAARMNCAHSNNISMKNVCYIHVFVSFASWTFCHVVVALVCSCRYIKYLLHQTWFCFAYLSMLKINSSAWNFFVSFNQCYFFMFLLQICRAHIVLIVADLYELLCMFCCFSLISCLWTLNVSSIFN